MVQQTRGRTLVIRLSSLGDVILCTSAIEALSVQARKPLFSRSPSESSSSVDWIVSKELSEVLKGHPGIGEVIEFDRAREGLLGWIRLCLRLSRRDYAQVLDLHCSLRSRIAKWVFFVSNWTKWVSNPRWRVLQKDRWRLYGYFSLKRFWPRAFRPKPLTERASLTAGGNGSERPNLTHLLKSSNAADLDLSLEIQKRMPYLCVMPAARWPGKQWPTEKYVEVLAKSRDFTPLVLGSAKDEASHRLADALDQRGIPFWNGIGKFTLPQVARILARSLGYVGSDTGLAHLAESVGVPAQVIFGPTVPDMGFGPWRNESVALGASLGCRPCGKDGRFCYRFWNRYECLTLVDPELISQAIRKRKQ